MDASRVNEARARDHVSPAAIRHLPAHLRLWLVAGITLWLDLWSKAWIFTNLGPDEERLCIPGVLALRRSLNAGAVFGSFAGQVNLFIIASVFALGFVFYLFAHSPRTHRVMHVALGLILAGAVGNLYDRSQVKADVLQYRASSGREGGIIGVVVSDPDDEEIRIGDWPDGRNPRTFYSPEVTVRHQGVVRDFIKFLMKFPAWVPRMAGRDVWPWVFNIADAALVCGVGTLLLTSWGRRTPHREEVAEPAP